MLKYLFSLDFVRSCLLACFLLFSSNATTEDWYTKTKYKVRDGGFIICTEQGAEELSNIRNSQVKAGEIIHIGSPRVLELVSEEEGCYFKNTEVVFYKISEKYTL